MEAKNMKINNECCCGCKTEKPDQIGSVLKSV